MSICRALACYALAWGSVLDAQLQFAEEIFPQLGQLLELSAADATEIGLIDLRMEERGGELDVAVGRKRPQVQTFVRVLGAYETRDDIGDRFRGNLYGNLTVNQPLYHWGALQGQQDIAEERIELEEVEGTLRSARHFMQIRRSYLEWLLLKQQLGIIEQSVALSESFVDARRKLVEVGRSSEQDVLEMEARLLENHETVEYIENRILSLERTLGSLVGPGLDGITLAEASLDRIVPMDRKQLLDLESRIRISFGEYAIPEVEKFSLLSDIESEQLAILDKSNHPKLDLVAGILPDYLESINNVDYILRMQYFAGLQIQWSIFDGWQKDGHMRSTLARKRSWDLQGQVARNSFEDRIEALLDNLELNLKQIEARSKRAEILQRRQSLVSEQVERDLLPGSERLEVEIDFLEVRQRLLEARVNYLINLMELGILLGQDPAQAYYGTEKS